MAKSVGVRNWAAWSLGGLLALFTGLAPAYSAAGTPDATPGAAAAAQSTDPNGGKEDTPWDAAEKARRAALGARGSEVFAKNCAVCHEHAVAHAPANYILKLMTPSSIYAALTTGAMRVQAQALSDEDKKAVAEFVGGANLESASNLVPAACTGEAAKFDFSQTPAFPHWGLTRTNTRYVDAATAGLSSANIGRLTLKWAVGFPGATRARSQPSIAGGAIYVGSQDGSVYALDRNTGCLRWRYSASAEVRTGIVVSPWKAGDAGAKPKVFFVDLVGNVYAVDAQTGKQVWKLRADSHPSTTLTATPVLYKKTLYVPVSSLEEGVAGDNYDCCTFRGSVIAFDARTGRKLWQRFMLPKPKPRGTNAKGRQDIGPSGIALWNTPAIDEKRGVLYFATGDNYSQPHTALSDAIVAMDLNSGRIKWSYQALEGDVWNAACTQPAPNACPEKSGPDWDFGAAAILATATDGRQYVLAGQKSGTVYALDPRNGKLVWKNKVGRGGILAGVYFGMATHGDSVFVPINDAPDGRQYQEPAKPGLYALNLHTGEYVWKAPSDDSQCKDRGPLCFPGIGAAITAVGDVVLAGAADGVLRAYEASSGKVVWQYDTLKEFKTVTGETARGGSFGGSAAPVPYQGTLLLPSGYGFTGRIPGNVLLVFGVE